MNKAKYFVCEAKRDFKYNGDFLKKRFKYLCKKDKNVWRIFTGNMNELTFPMPNIHFEKFFDLWNNKKVKKKIKKSLEKKEDLFNSIWYKINKIQNWFEKSRKGSE